MSAESPVPDYEAPGAYIEEAFDKCPDVLRRTFSLMLECPEPMTARCERRAMDISRMAALDMPESLSREDDEAAHLRGMQWAYALAVAADVSTVAAPAGPAQVAGKPQKSLLLPMTSMPFGQQLTREGRYEALRKGVDEYAAHSTRAVLFAEEIGQVADPAEFWPNLTRHGVLSGLYMINLGFRNLQAFRVEKARRQQEAEAERERWEEQQHVNQRFDVIRFGLETEVFKGILGASGFGIPGESNRLD